MLRGATLAVAAVCLGCVCHCLQAELMSRLVVPRDYGVKLCGREFIRAVIFTCGGSRWRRSAESSSGPLQWTLTADAAADLPEVTSALGSLSSLADLVAFYRQRGWSLELEEEEEQQQQQQQHLVPADGPTSSKKKRNFSLGVAGKCCSQGCTKNDIGRLC
ncbi:prorelaxin H1 [Nelusetta ayraudi]|uniref:prorelaxin H1 n=1 Tax=Nelusetta ayraudi TaxID=303726 RepID=UPI003F6F3590